QPLVRMHDPQLEAQMLKLQSEIDAAAKEVETLDAEIARAKPEQRLTMSAERETRVITIYFKTNELNAIRDRVQAIPSGKAGYFVVKSPIDGTVLNQSFREELTNKSVKPNEPILRVG